MGWPFIVNMTILPTSCQKSVSAIKILIGFAVELDPKIRGKNNNQDNILKRTRIKKTLSHM
jgi:hypothetical protein